MKELTIRATYKYLIEELEKANKEADLSVGSGIGSNRKISARSYADGRLSGFIAYYSSMTGLDMIESEIQLNKIAGIRKTIA